MVINRFLFLLLLLPSLASAQIPGIMASQWAGVSVRDSLAVELYAENYVKGNAGVAAKWYDAQNPAVFASQSVVARMPDASGTYVYFSLTDTLTIATLPSSLSAGANTVIMVAQQAPELAYTGVHWPMLWSGGTNIYGNMIRNDTGKDYTYCGAVLGIPTAIASLTLRFSAVSLGASGRIRVNNISASGTTGTTGLPIQSAYIGFYPVAPYYYFVGSVYAFLVYNRQLSDAEVTIVFNELASHYGLTIP